MKNIFLSIGLFFALSCNSEHPDYYKVKSFSIEDAPFTKKLSGHKMEIKGIQWPRRILNLDDYLIVSENKADTFLHIIEKKGMNIVHKVGLNGRGPREIGWPWRILKGKGPEEFWVHSLTEKKLTSFTASSSSLLGKDEINLNKVIKSGVDFVFSSDSTIMAILSDSKDKFVEFEISGKKIKSYDTWGHMTEKQLPFSAIAELHSGVLNVSPDKRYFALAGINIDFVDILDKVTGSVVSVRGPLQYFPKFEIDHSTGYPKAAFFPEGNDYQYLNTCLTNNYIYALFSGATVDQVNKTQEKYCNDIFLFDYQGNVRGHYELDISLVNFTVDEDNRKIYGLSFDNNPNLVVYDF